MVPVASLERPSIRPLAVVLTGALALATAMGIGRFAFTPLLPMMLHDGAVDIAGGSWLATANYLGYLAGAVLCMVLPRLRALAGVTNARIVRLGLIATILLTLGMAADLPGLWPALRFLAGVTSACVFIFTAQWTMITMARLGRSATGAAIFVGPGAGIAVTGLAAGGMVGADWSAATGWLCFGLLACLFSALAWAPLAEGTPIAGGTAPAATRGTGPPRRAGRLVLGLFTLAYGLAGFGYIITATFLPVIAREVLPGSGWLDLFWPIFGLGVMLGALVSSRIPVAIDPRLMLVGCYAIQGVGVMAALWVPSLAGFAIGSLMVGLPLTAITFFAMQEVRRLAPDSIASFIGLLTATYGIGQIAGPPLVQAILHRSASNAAGFTLSLEIAAASLGLGGAIYLWLCRLYPADRPARG